MVEVTPKERLVLNEWKQRQEQYERAKQELKDVLGRHGLASSEFNSARVEFEMLKEEFDSFEKEHHTVLAKHQRV